MRLNKTTNTNVKRTHEGAPASRITPFQELQRSTMSCLLWEDGFYENGETIANRLKALVAQCNTDDVLWLADKTRNEWKLRHAPLLLARECARKKDNTLDSVLPRIVKRPDEICEFMAIYWKDGKTPIASKVKKGLSEALRKFDEYQLAKWNRPRDIKLKDVIRMIRPKPLNQSQSDLWKRLLNDELATPDTWEVALSSGANKKETFTRLLTERLPNGNRKLGYIALLMNLRNMHESRVDPNLIREALLEGAPHSKALPFRFVAAARAVPYFEPTLDHAMILALGAMEKISGTTAIAVDVSGSMTGKLSMKSDITNMDAACALAALVEGICENVRIFSFSNNIFEIPRRKGMALIDAIRKSQPHSGTYLGKAIQAINNDLKKYDRIIVITDEQTRDPIPNPINRGYMINVASNENGIGYGKWTHITGFSESVINYIREYEKIF